jgi:glycosyltransferase involved in cell wall biosynthesis
MGPFRVWLPHIRGGSGSDVYTQRLATGLTSTGHEVYLQGFAHRLQYAPHMLRLIRPPRNVDIVIANSWNAFAFRRPGAALIAVEHHCIFDPCYKPFRSFAQAVFHEVFVRQFERSSFSKADRIVAVSNYTASIVRRIFSLNNVDVVPNGMDTDFYSPAPPEKAPRHGPFRLLFVGNLSRRKGADLLRPIMERLGPGYELHYTLGLRGGRPLPQAPNMRPLPSLTNAELRNEYRAADALLFPSRLEGFGYGAAEALACGTPVIASRGSSLPEIIQHGVTGLLCDSGDVAGFAAAARELAADRQRLMRFSRAARQQAVGRFSLPAMAGGYDRVFAELRGLSPAARQDSGDGNRL